MEFMLGCNYWASNAGTDMWREWDEEAIREDLSILTAHGVKYLRVFPNWRDFQPVKPLYTGRCRVREYALKDDTFPDNPYYLDSTMVERFKRFCEIADEFGCKLIVGLVTGWMSGRMYIPPALYGKNLFTDPTALMFQQKYVKGLVLNLRDCPAIYAWDLGNECNCMYDVESRDVARFWTTLIADTIRAYDSTRQIVSGMHSIKVDGDWTIADQAESTDILTTHPYPHWVEHCREDKIGSFRTLVHATAESVFYSSIGDRPCLVEEIGTMGPMICSDEVAGNFLKVNMFSNWANGQAGVMWWCANEQDALNSTPYTWNMMERELGMIDRNRKPKPVLAEMKKFSEFLKSLPFELPKSKVDAICILSMDTDHWGVAYMTYLFAKQAGLNIRFCDVKEPFPDAKYYLLPSMMNNVMKKERYEELKEKIKNGAKIYMSNDFGFLTEFSEVVGLKVIDSENARDNGTMELDGETINFSRMRKFTTEPTGAQVIAYDNSGLPCYTVNKFGEGEVYYLNFPLEKSFIEKNDAFGGNHYKIYSKFFEDVLKQKTVFTANQYVGITEHEAEDGVYAVIINYSPESQALNLKVKDGFKITKTYYGNTDTLAPYESAVVLISKE